jgi:hypothetical protein
MDVNSVQAHDNKSSQSKRYLQIMSDVKVYRYVLNLEFLALSAWQQTSLSFCEDIFLLMCISLITSEFVTFYFNC